MVQVLLLLPSNDGALYTHTLRRGSRVLGDGGYIKEGVDGPLTVKGDRIGGPAGKLNRNQENKQQ